MSLIHAYSGTPEPGDHADWEIARPWPPADWPPGIAEYPGDENRDLAEEAYWRAFCIPCGTSPCDWDGTPDGFHADDPDPAGPDTLRDLREPS